MKLLFAPNQPYQLDAVRAVTDIFEGQGHGGEELKIKCRKAHFKEFEGVVYERVSKVSDIVPPLACSGNH